MNDTKIYNLRDIGSAFRKRLKLLIAVVLLFLCAAALYSAVTEKKYTATARLFLDKLQSSLVTETQDSQSETGVDYNTIIDSKLILLTSQRVADMVLEELNDKDYLKAKAENDYSTIEKITNKLLAGLSVSRTGETLIVNIRYTATDREYAAQAANAFADVFVLEQIAASRNFSTMGQQWIKSKIESLSQKMKSLQSDILTYRTKHNLHKSGDSFVDDSQLFEVNRQLGEARAESAQAQAEYEHSKAVVASKNAEAAVAQAFDNEVINSIRTDYLAVKKKRATLLTRLGSDHTLTKKTEKEISDYRDIIIDEMKRMLQIHLANFEVAKAQEKALENSLKGILGKTTSKGEFYNTLFQLEQEAENSKALYSSYLEKLATLDQQASLEITESRVITEAQPPGSPSHPNVPVLLAIALFMGLGTSTVLILYLDSNDDTIRDAADLNRDLGIDFFGHFPAIKNLPSQLEADQYLTRDFRINNPLFSRSTTSPLSMFAETCRRASSGIERQTTTSPCKIGIISTSPNEGKSTTALNLAMLLAKQQKRCLLVDTDLRNPTFLQPDFNEPVIGIGSVLNSTSSLEDAVLKERSTGLHVLTAVHANLEEGLNNLTHRGLSLLMSLCQDQYDYVIFDLPPLSATADAMHFAPIVDGYLLVTEWGKTKKSRLMEQLHDSGIPSTKLFGAIINKSSIVSLKKKFSNTGFKNYLASELR